MAQIDRLVDDARALIAPRVTVDELDAVVRDGGLLVDIRPVEQRAADGELPGAVVIPRNVLEWRLDPTCEHRIPELTGPEQRIVLVCDEGYATSLAAASLRQLGLGRATDLVGGYQAWRNRGGGPTPRPAG